MSHAMDREEFDEVIDTIRQVQEKTMKAEKTLRLLKSKTPDSRLGYLYYEAFGDGAGQQGRGNRKNEEKNQVAW